VPDLETGSDIARTHDYNTITLEGDRVDRKGLLTGGFMDRKHSRLAAANQVNEVELKMDEQCSRSNRLKMEVSAVDQEITRLVGALQALESTKRRALNDIESIDQKLVYNSKLIEDRVKTIEEMVNMNVSNLYFTYHI